MKIPNSVIGAVASVIGAHYYSHSQLDMLFMESGAPGDAPDGNCEKKCSNWLKRCNDDPTVEPLEVLGAVIQEYMDKEPPSSLYGENFSTKAIDGDLSITQRKAIEFDKIRYAKTLRHSV